MPPSFPFCIPASIELVKRLTQNYVLKQHPVSGTNADLRAASFSSAPHLPPPPPRVLPSSGSHCPFSQLLFLLTVAGGKSGDIPAIWSVPLPCQVLHRIHECLEIFPETSLGPLSPLHLKSYRRFSEFRDSECRVTTLRPGPCGLASSTDPIACVAHAQCGQAV